MAALAATATADIAAVQFVDAIGKSSAVFILLGTFVISVGNFMTSSLSTSAIVWCSLFASSVAAFVDDVGDVVDLFTIDDGASLWVLHKAGISDVIAVVVVIVLDVVVSVADDEATDTSDKAVSSLLKSGGGVAYIEAAIFLVTGRGCNENPASGSLAPYISWKINVPHIGSNSGLDFI
ncbi:hypothetical protein GQX74_004597 [Glossina fuscipes]|nr:hypothetical protein GQX74_004597 [Glossina fuscipes]